jgi:hypothetical protein
MNDDGTFELGEKLSEDDHGHLKARWDVTALRRNAENLGVDPATALNAERWSYDEYEAALADAAEKDGDPDDGAETNENAGVPGGSNDPQTPALGAKAPIPAAEPGAVLPTTGSGTVDGANPNVEDGEGPVLYAENSPEDKPYPDWTNDELRAEIEARNTEFADEEDFTAMSTTGTKAELVKRLEDNDAENDETE